MDSDKNNKIDLNNTIILQKERYHSILFSEKQFIGLNLRYKIMNNQNY